MKTSLILPIAIASLLQSAAILPVAAQNDGDQIVDGIGETALISRYQLAGDAQDRSRNGHHGALHGTGATFVDDDKFGKVLSLSGDGAYLQLPGDTLDGEETATVTAWVFLRASTAGQRVFDFGRNGTLDFYAVAAGDHAGAHITTSGAAGEQATPMAAIPANTWVHLAVVLDTTRKTLVAYVNGAKTAQADNVAIHLDQVIKQDAAAANHLYLGKSQSDTDPSLNAKLHDVRIYRTALSDQQIATIRNNAWSGTTTTTVAANGSATPETKAAEGKPETLESRITAVSDVSVETTEGFLPRLPYTVPTTYRDGIHGPEARVIWPSPTDNSQVLKAGNYMVTGKVPGTSLTVKASVTVKAAAAAAPGPKRELEPFPLGQVILNQDTQKHDTQFMQNRDKFFHGLTNSNPDRFLWAFRNAFGQPQPAGAQALGGWDSPTTKLRGHATGHYLSALAQSYASTSYDKALQTNFLQKMNYMIDTLYDLAQKSGKATNEGGTFVADPLAIPFGPGRSNYDSDFSRIRTDYQNWGKGFISAYPPDEFIMLEHGATYGTRANQIWAPYYTLHKILAGLLDCYEVGGNKKALEIAENMGNWVYQRLKVLPPNTRMSMWGRYIAGEYGGMNEVMARLYRLTGDKQYIECAKLFDNTQFFFGDTSRTHGLAKNVDTLRGRHANQHIPQITGALETYRDTDEVPYYEVADNFWDICTHDYMYSIGGVAGAKTPNNAECFTAQPNSLSVDGFNSGGQNETCATYNMLKLSRQLFMYDQDAKFMDYYEQALYNDILASVAANNAGNTYHIPLNPGARKSFGNANMGGFTCCNGTALESNTKLQDSIYFQSVNNGGVARLAPRGKHSPDAIYASADNSALYVNLYIPSTLTWPERNVVIKQVTSYPHEDTTRINVNGAGNFAINVRVPDWVTKGFTVKINGQEQSVKATPGTYLALQRTWKDGDSIELKMPFDFHLSHVMDKPEIASIFYGPILLAAQESGQLSTWRSVTLNADDLGQSITGDASALHFKIGDVPLKPFYESYGNYSVYFNVALKQAPAGPP